jgi:hypothetical protein
MAIGGPLQSGPAGHTPALVYFNFDDDSPYNPALKNAFEEVSQWKPKKFNWASVVPPQADPLSSVIVFVVVFHLFCKSARISKFILCKPPNNRQ